MFVCPEAPVTAPNMEATSNSRKALDCTSEGAFCDEQFEQTSPCIFKVSPRIKQVARRTFDGPPGIDFRCFSALRVGLAKHLLIDRKVHSWTDGSGGCHHAADHNPEYRQ